MTTPRTYHMPRLSRSSLFDHRINFLRNTDYKAPVMLYSPFPVPRPSQAQMSSSVPYSRTPSEYLPLPI